MCGGLQLRGATEWMNPEHLFSSGVVSVADRAPRTDQQPAPPSGPSPVGSHPVSRGGSLQQELRFEQPCTQDLRPLPLRQRKDRLARLLARVRGGIALNEHTDARGELVFRQACAMGLEGIVSKRLISPYKSGPSRDWIKVKNPDSPAMVRHREGRWE
jgi:ATP dependent DNA ligase domain